MTTTSKSLTQWHPAFSRALQIDLQQDSDNLYFEEEFCIRKLPSRMDLRITMRNPSQTLHKDIGRIFTRYNLIEYKPPGDYLSLDDFAYTLGSGYLMKSGGKYENAIPFKDISLSMVGYHYPRKLMGYLEAKTKLQITQHFPGIYYLTGDIFPIQIAVVKELDPNQYLWLTSLRYNLNEEQQNLLLQNYEQHKNDRYFEEVMSFIATINQKEFRRRPDMCKGLMDIVRPEIEQEKRDAIEAARPGIIAEAKPTIIQECCLDIARSLKLNLGLDSEIIARELHLSPDVVRQL